MFTGIVECLGKVKSNFSVLEGSHLSIIADDKITQTLKIGDSISINGVCQTVVKFFLGGFLVQASKETLEKTNIGGLKSCDLVNLETPLSLSTPLGGHLVLGHVDGVGVIESVRDEGFSKRFAVSCGKEVYSYIAPKGSITVDGVSLTVVDGCETATEGFSISVIPHTLRSTTLQFYRPGYKVNLEADIIGKYVVGFLKKNEKNKDNAGKSDISVEFLRNAGFTG